MLIVDVPGGSLAAKLYNGLVRLDRNLNVGPDIAEKWEVRDGGTTYVFHLRRGVLFANGREVTAWDFRYSFERILAPHSRSPNAWVLEKLAGTDAFEDDKEQHVRGIEVEDAYTLILKLSEPFSPFLSQLTMTACYVVPKEEVEKWGVDFSSHPMGTGPYILSEWRHGSEVVLKRNTSYFGACAKVTGLVYRIIPEDLTAAVEFETGNLDVLSVPASEYAKYRNSPEWKDLLSSAVGLNTYYLGFNCSRPPFSDVNLRIAVAHALDREKILAAFYEGRGIPAKGPVPDRLRRWRSPLVPGYDPRGAEALIKKARARGLTINFYVTNDQEAADIAAIIQSRLSGLGLRVAIRQLEWSAYKAALNAGEADMFWISWWADYPDAENFLFPLFHSSNRGAAGNRSRFVDHRVDQLLERGRSAQSQQESVQYYGKAEEIISAQCPIVPFWHKTESVLRQRSVRNFMIYPVYTMDKGLDFSL
jgi:peptide/nickel transport system substrate-binding protein/oligopeptide transport system substrate-binding protein